MVVIDSAAAGARAVGQHPASGAALVGTFCSVFDWFDLSLGAAATTYVLLRQHTLPGIYASLFAVAPVFARLLGAAIIGGYGDRVGRKAALLITLLLMSVASLLLGLMMESEVQDPALLLVLRIIQGAAVGAAWAGCVCLPLEWADQAEKGRYAAWPQIGAPAGLVLSYVVFFILWPLLGLCFLVAGAIGLFAAGVVWSHAAESPVLIDDTRDAIATSPLIAAIRYDYREILLVALLRVVEIVAFFVFTEFVFFYVRTRLAYDVRITVWAACLAAVVAIPIFGRLSDRFGHMTIYMIGALATGVWAFLYIAVLDTAIPELVLVAIAVSLLPYAMMAGPQAALIAESFPAPRRYSGCSLGTQLGAVIAVVPAPTVAGYLFTQFNSGYAVAFFVLGCSSISLFAAFALRQREMVKKLESTVEAAIRRAGVDAITISKFSVPDIIAKVTGNKALLNMLERSRALSSRPTGWMTQWAGRSTEAPGSDTTVTVERPEPADLGPKRHLNAWINDAAPIAGKPFHILINIGVPTGTEIGSAAFAQLDWRGIESIDLIVTLSSVDCTVEPGWYELKLRRAGDSDMLDFIVTARVTSSHEFTVSVYLARQMIRLQSLSFTVAVAPERLQAVGAAS